MLFNPDAVVNSRKPMQAKEDRAQWDWFERWKLNEGTYRIKFLSHSEKCPDGHRLYTAHKFEKDPGETDKKKLLKCFCTESTHGIREGYTKVIDENGKAKAVPASALNRPCYICDMLEDMRRIDDGQWYEELPEDYRKILNEMSSAICRNFLFPAIIYVKEVPTDKGSRYAPGDTPKAIILSLNISKDSADMTLYRLILKLVKKHKAEFFSPTGIWCSYEKSRTSQDLTEEEPTRLTKEEEKLYKGYPNLMEWGKGVASGSYQKASLNVGYEKMRAMVKSSWWSKAMAKDPPRGVGYDFDDVEEGLACTIPNEVTPKAKVVAVEADDEEED